MFKMTIVAFSVFISSVVGSLLLTKPSTENPKEAAIVDASLRQDQEAEDIKETARQAFMQAKLESNKKIVQGLTTNDYQLIQTAATEVSALVKGQHWFVLNTPEYKNYSEEMNAAAKKLHSAAEGQNIEASALRYFDLTVSCIDCHQYIATTNY